MKSNIPVTYFHSISQFKFINGQLLGKGSFGKVKLAVHQQTNKIYAIKIIYCNQLYSDICLKALQQEIIISTQINHPHIVKVWQVLSDSAKIYLIMEYLENGNLFFYQTQKKIFTEEESSIFFMQTLSAIQYLHTLNLIHRDIKPENLLLDKDFNLKLCDLGWATRNSSQGHITFCGTYQYMAPQMLFQRVYDHRIDIWALGILLYQMLHGYAPFTGQKISNVKFSISHGEIKLDSSLTPNCQDLIMKILRSNPDQRLTIQQIKQHPWIAQRSQIKKCLIKCLKYNKNKSTGKLFQKQNQPNNYNTKSSKKKSSQKLNRKNSADQTTKYIIPLSPVNKKQPCLKQQKTKILLKKEQKNLAPIFQESRLKTEFVSNKTYKYQHLRTKTLYNQGNGSIEQRSTIKKKKLNYKKKINPLNSHAHLSRKSIN